MAATSRLIQPWERRSYERLRIGSDGGDNKATCRHRAALAKPPDRPARRPTPRDTPIRCRETPQSDVLNQNTGGPTSENTLSGFCADPGKPVMAVPKGALITRAVHSEDVTVAPGSGVLVTPARSHFRHGLRPAERACLISGLCRGRMMMWSWSGVTELRPDACWASCWPKGQCRAYAAETRTAASTR